MNAENHQQQLSRFCEGCGHHLSYHPKASLKSTIYYNDNRTEQNFGNDGINADLLLTKLDCYQSCSPHIERLYEYCFLDDINDLEHGTQSFERDDKASEYPLKVVFDEENYGLIDFINFDSKQEDAEFENEYKGKEKECDRSIRFYDFNSSYSSNEDDNSSIGSSCSYDSGVVPFDSGYSPMLQCGNDLYQSHFERRVSFSSFVLVNDDVYLDSSINSDDSEELTDLNEKQVSFKNEDEIIGFQYPTRSEWITRPKQVSFKENDEVIPLPPRYISIKARNEASFDATEEKTLSREHSEADETEFQSKTDNLRTEVVYFDDDVSEMMSYLRKNPLDRYTWKITSMFCSGIEKDSAYGDSLYKAGIAPILSSYAGTDEWTSTFSELILKLCIGRDSDDRILTWLPTLVRVLNSAEELVLVNTLKSLCILSHSSNTVRVQMICESGVIPRTVELMLHPNNAVKIAALRLIGNIVAGDDVQTQHVIEACGLLVLKTLQNIEDSQVRKEVFWVISNIAAGTPKQINLLFSTGAVPGLIRALNDDCSDVRKEAAWCVGNILNGGTSDEIGCLLKFGCVTALCAQLSSSDEVVLAIVLEALDCILNFSKRLNMRFTADEIERCGGLDRIEALQFHQGHRVYERATYLVAEYFCDPECH